MVYTSDLKSDARNRLMGSTPIGATTCCPPFSDGFGNPIKWCRPSPTDCERLEHRTKMLKYLCTFAGAVEGNRRWGDFRVISSMGRAPDF